MSEPQFHLSKILNLQQFEPAAKKILSPMAYAYFSGGACDEITLRENRTCWDKIKLWPRVLRGVNDPDLTSRLFGNKVTLPFLPAPVAMLKLAYPDGESALVRATNLANIPCIASTMATTKLEDIAKESKGYRYFQLYCFKDKGLTKALIQRAEAAGYQGLIVTVDAQILGKREADTLHKFHLPPGLKLENLDDSLNGIMQQAEGSGAERISARFDTHLNWNSMEAILTQTKLPWGLKGILHPDDAKIAADLGAHAIFISNHGGRQLDGVPTALDVLPLIDKAVQGRAEIFMDGGIFRGTDILKAIALGANGVLIGKPFVYALAVAGEAGVSHLFHILLEELKLAMCLLGCQSLSDLDQSFLFNF